jgi:hypothetical protein
MEHRFEKSLQNHNSIFAMLQKIKEKLKAARRERVIYDNIFKTLETDIKVKEEDLKKLVLESVQVESEYLKIKELNKQIMNLQQLE